MVWDGTAFSSFVLDRLAARLCPAYARDSVQSRGGVEDEGEEVE